MSASAGTIRRQAPPIPSCSACSTPGTERAKSGKMRDSDHHLSINGESRCDQQSVKMTGVYRHSSLENGSIHRPSSPLDTTVYFGPRSTFASNSKRAYTIHCSRNDKLNFNDKPLPENLCKNGWSTFHSKKILVSLDLPNVCHRLVELLGRLDQLSDHLGPDGNSVLQETALCRYVAYWLPLAAEHKLASGAPLDVYWVWIAHMLDPVVYRSDCQRMFGSLIEHRLVSSKKEKKITDKARGLWQERYPHEPYDFDPNRTAFGQLRDKLKSNGRSSLYNSKISEEVLPIMKCHQHFYYQISLPHYSDPDFLKEARRRYQMFLHVKKIQYQMQQGQTTVSQRKYSTLHSSTLTSDYSPIIPEINTAPGYLPFDIELCWRAHILHPRIYARDTSCLIGRLLPHSCDVYKNCMLSYLNEIHPNHLSMNSENHVGLFIPSFEQLWSKCFPEEQVYRHGSVDRGLSSRKQLGCLTVSDIYKMATKSTQLTINQVTAQLHPSVDKFSLRIQHLGHRGGGCVTNGSGSCDTEQCVARLNSPGRVWSAVGPKKPVARLLMTSGVQDNLLIELIDKRGWLCPNNSLLGRTKLTLTSVIEQFPGTEPVDLELSGDFKVDASDIDCVNNLQKSSPSTPRTSSNKTNTAGSSSNSCVRLHVTITPPKRHAVWLKVQLGSASIVRVPPLHDQSPNFDINVWGFVPSSPFMEPSFTNQRAEQMTFNSDIRNTYKVDLESDPTSPLGSIKKETRENAGETRSLMLTHKLLNHTGDHVFTVRVLHSLANKISTVQVLKDESLLCVGHTVDNTQLPTMSIKSQMRKTERQVKPVITQNQQDTVRKKTLGMFTVPVDHFITRNLTNGTKQVDEDAVLSTVDEVPLLTPDETTSGWGFHPQREERAMIVKDSQGDWCMVIGHWAGFKRFPDPQIISSLNEHFRNSKQQSNGNYPTRGSGGYLSLRMRYLRSHNTNTVYTQVPDTMNNCSILLQNAIVDLRTGEINIGKNCDDIAQNICLAFCCSILHVLCQPRILVQEGDLDLANMMPAKLPFQPPISRPSESIMTNLSTVCDPDPETLLTASTSFDSNVQTQPLPLERSCTQIGDRQISNNCISREHKIEWIMVTEPPQDRHAQGNHSTNPDIANASWNSSSLFSSIEVLGFPQFVFRPLNASPTIEFCQHSAHLRPLSVHECYNHILASEEERRRRACSDPYKEGCIRKRGTLASLSFLMCQSVGILVDTLLPSVQNLRQIERSKQLHAILQQNNFAPAFLERHEPASPCSSSIINGSKREDIYSNTTRSYDSFTEKDANLRDSEISSPLETSKENGVLNSSKCLESSGTSNRLLPPIVNLSKQPFIGWRLSDFYDYFLLDLPDICPGCLSGCQFCSGVGVL